MTDTPDICERLRDLLSRAHPVPWELQDGSSWRRIGSKHGPCGNVLCPTNCRHDNHPDLTAADGLLYDNLKLIVEGVNALPALLAHIARLTSARESVMSGLQMLHRAVVEEDPRGELLVRIDDLILEVEALRSEKGGE